MKRQIEHPLRALPWSSSSPAALADAQGRALKALRRSAAALDEKIAGLEGDADLTDTARGRKTATLRQNFVDNNTGGWHEALDRGALAEELLNAYYNVDAIRTRSVFAADSGDVVAWTMLLSNVVPADLYLAAVEIGRSRDFAAASLVLSETRARLAADTIALDDALAIMDLAEAVPLPAAELAAKEALQNVVIGALEADEVYRGGTSGQSPSAVEKLQRQRRIQAVKGELPDLDADVDSERWTPERRKAAGLP